MTANTHDRELRTHATLEEYGAKGKPWMRGRTYNNIKISILKDGALSFFDTDGGESHIYLYPSQVARMISAYQRWQNTKRNHTLTAKEKP